MSFSRNIQPFVESELHAAAGLLEQGEAEAAFKHLESAHVLGQASTRWHTLVHVRMLQWAIKRRDVREIAGQLLRIVGAATKTAIGLVPHGNTGGAKVNPFKAMPISEAHREILTRASIGSKGRRNRVD
ncbi:MAG: DUF3703 domain-containing protein [Woeseia sp.]